MTVEIENISIAELNIRDPNILTPAIWVDLKSDERNYFSGKYFAYAITCKIRSPNKDLSKSDYVRAQSFYYKDDEGLFRNINLDNYYQVDNEFSVFIFVDFEALENLNILEADFNKIDCRLLSQQGMFSRAFSNTFSIDHDTLLSIYNNYKNSND